MEFAVYQLSTSDFLYRRRLSIMHAQIPSSELPAWIDRSAIAFVQRGIHRQLAPRPGHTRPLASRWSAQPRVHAKAGLSLLFTPLLLLLGRRWIGDRTRSAAWRGLAIAALYIAIITYVLAMDPKPRVMLIPLALASLSIAIIISDLYRRHRRLLAVVVAVGASAAGLLMTASSMRMGWSTNRHRFGRDNILNKLKSTK